MVFVTFVVSLLSAASLLSCTLHARPVTQFTSVTQHAILVTGHSTIPLNPVNILYLAHRIPYPPNKGEKIRAFHQIRQLARNHTVHVCAFVDDPADLPHIPALRKHCASVEVVYRKGGLALVGAAVGFLLRRPLSVSLFYRKAFALMIEQKLAAERFDCIICSSSSMAQYASLANGLPKVIDFIDVDSEKWRLYAQRHAFPMSYIYRLEASRLAKYEDNNHRNIRFINLEFGRGETGTSKANAWWFDFSDLERG